MNDLVLEILVNLFVFWAVFFLIYTVLNEMNNAKEEMQRRQGVDLDNSLADILLALPPRYLFTLKLIFFAVFFLLGLVLVDWLVGAALGAFAFFIPSILLKRLKLKRQLLLEQQLVEGLELLKNGLKSGLTLQQAAELLVKEFPPPLSQEFSMVLAEARLGIDFLDGLHKMADRLDSTVVQILATGVSITKRCGGDLTEIFGNLAETIREQAKIEGKLQAVTAQGRTQGLVLGAMPFALLVAMYFIDRAHVETLFGYQLGVYAFVLTVLMVLIAQLWIRKLLDIDV